MDPTKELVLPSAGLNYLNRRTEEGVWVLVRDVRGPHPAVRDWGMDRTPVFELIGIEDAGDDQFVLRARFGAAEGAREWQAVYAGNEVVMLIKEAQGAR